jgi:hypothetical protein
MDRRKLLKCAIALPLARLLPEKKSDPRIFWATEELKLGDIYISQEGLEDIRNWGAAIIDNRNILRAEFL